MADLLQALVQFYAPMKILFFFVALLLGLFFGAIPGVNMLTLGAIILPFTAYLETTTAIMIFSVLYVSGTYGGAVMAILFNIPGSAENAPTALDGYPLTKQGKAGKAIGAAVMSSSIGGALSALIVIIVAEPVSRLAVQFFGPIEMFAIIFLGLAVAASVGASSLCKGWLSVLMGLLIACVGTDPAGGIPRFAFGSYYLMAGIGFVPLILGLFAISEVFIQGEKLVKMTYKSPEVSLQFPTIAEMLALKWAILRSWIIGFCAGVLPGVGATLAAFLSYNETVRWSKHPERFGKGELAGVVASETANNAATGGAMVPLLSLGLPGGAITAMMISIFMMHGLEPGPLIMVRAKSLVYIVLTSMLVANLFIFLLGYIETKTIVNLLRIPFVVMAPTILVLATLGAYSLRNILIDVWVMFLAGIAGYFLRRTGFSPAGIILGVILGKIGEGFFIKAMQLMNYNLFGFTYHPIAVVLLAGGLLSIIINIVKPPKRK